MKLFNLLRAVLRLAETDLTKTGVLQTLRVGDTSGTLRGNATLGGDFSRGPELLIDNRERDGAIA